MQFCVGRKPGTILNILGHLFKFGAHISVLQELSFTLFIAEWKQVMAKYGAAGLMSANDNNLEVVRSRRNCIYTLL